MNAGCEVSVQQIGPATLVFVRAPHNTSGAALKAICDEAVAAKKGVLCLACATVDPKPKREGTSA